MFISMMFAGHHTTSTTASWTLIELLRHPECCARVVAELDALYADGREVSYQALREIPRARERDQGDAAPAPAADPPDAQGRCATSSYKDWTVPAGKHVGVSPAVSNRMPECFPEPERFDPDSLRAARARRTSSASPGSRSAPAAIAASARPSR